MKNYLFLLLICACALAVTTQLKWHQIEPADPRVPAFLWKYINESKKNFSKPENANLYSAFLFGTKSGISPHTREAFKKTNLSFLLKPSGIHLNSLFLVIAFLLKRKSRKIYNFIHWGLLLAILVSPAADNLKRLSLLRLGYKIRFQFRQKWRNEIMLTALLIISFFLAHYFKNPYSFIISFLYIGTFFLLSAETRTLLVLSLFLNSIVTGLFLGTKVSLAAIITSLAGVSLFTLFHPLVVIYFFTWKIVSFNWLEIFITYFVLLIKTSAKLTHGTFTSASLFLALAVGLLIFHRKNKVSLLTFSLCLALHTNTAMTPCLFKP